LEAEYSDKILRGRFNDIDEDLVNLRTDLDTLATNFASLSVLVNNIRQCVDTQTSIFEESTRRR